MQYFQKAVRLVGCESAKKISPRMFYCPQFQTKYPKTNIPDKVSVVNNLIWSHSVNGQKYLCDATGSAGPFSYLEYFNSVNH